MRDLSPRLIHLRHASAQAAWKQAQVEIRAALLR